MQPTLPILEFDPSREAVIEPAWPGVPANLPEHCVPCFFAEVIETLTSEHGAREVHHAGTEMGRHAILTL